MKTKSKESIIDQEVEEQDKNKTDYSELIKQVESEYQLA
jgi:hypothetical protein